MQSEATVRECLVLYKRRKRHRVPQQAVSAAELAADLFVRVIPDGPREHFVVLALDAKNVPIGWWQIGVGTLDARPVAIQEILRFASEFGADLIVLSSHRFDPERAAASWGTISYKVGLVSPCPVLLMR